MMERYLSSDDDPYFSGIIRRQNRLSSVLEKVDADFNAIRNQDNASSDINIGHVWSGLQEAGEKGAAKCEAVAGKRKLDTMREDGREVGIDDVSTRPAKLVILEDNIGGDRKVTQQPSSTLECPSASQSITSGSNKICTNLTAEMIPKIRSQNDGRFPCFFFLHDKKKYAACENHSYENFCHLR